MKNYHNMQWATFFYDPKTGALKSRMSIIHAMLVKKRLEEGMNYINASPVYNLNRQEAADIMTVPWKTLREKYNESY